MHAYNADMEAARREAPADIEWPELDGHHGIPVLNVPVGSPEYVHAYMRGKAEELREEVDASLSKLLSAKPSRRYTHALHHHAWALLKHCVQHKAGYWLRNCLPSEVDASAEAVDATVLAAVERVLGVSFDPSTYGIDTNPVVTESLAELLHDPDPMAAEAATLSEDAVAMARSMLHLRKAQYTSVPPPDEAGPSTSRAATFGLPDVAAVNPIHRDPAKGKGPAIPLPSYPQVEKGKAKMLSPIPEELHSAFPPKTEEEPGRPPLQVDPRLRRGWDPNYENFDDWFSVWPEPESLYGEDYADLHYAMCKWLRDWEFDKFDIEYQPPPLRVEIADLRRFALVWMPWFMVTGLGLTPFEGPVRRGKMSFLRCLIDGVPWDVFPPGVGMSWWSAEQISRSLDLARTKFTASQDPTTRQGMSLISTGRWWSTTGSPSCFQCNHPDHQRLLDLNRSCSERRTPSRVCCRAEARIDSGAGCRQDPERMSCFERRTPSRACCRAAARIDSGAGCRQDPERRSCSERRTPSRACCRAAARIDSGAGCRQDPERRSWSERRTPSRACCRAEARIDSGAGCRQDPERRTWSERRTPSRACCRAAARIDSGAGCRQGAAPSGAPPPVFAAEPKPASTVAPAVGKTPSAGAAPSGAPPPVFAAEPKPASTVAPAVGKTPSAGADPSGAPPPVFAAEPKPASTVAPAVGKTPSAGAAPSGAPPPVFAAEPKPASTVAPAVGKVSCQIGYSGCQDCAAQARTFPAAGNVGCVLTAGVCCDVPRRVTPAV
eukprot:jgi/Tetstr1/458613/TSEL_045016.t1